MPWTLQSSHGGPWRLLERGQAAANRRRTWLSRRWVVSVSGKAPPLTATILGRGLCTSGHPLLEAQRGEREQQCAQDRERGELRPQHVDAAALEEYPANDHEEVAQWIDERDPLRRLRHVGDRKHEAGQQHRGQVEEERRHQR